MPNEQCPEYASLASQREDNKRALDITKEFKERRVPDAEMMSAKAQKDLAETDIKIAEHLRTCDECKKG